MARSRLLTSREILLLDLVKDGYMDSEIAKQIGVVTGTVKNDLSLIRAKLQARNRVEAVIKALRQHYIQLDNENAPPAS